MQQAAQNKVGHAMKLSGLAVFSVAVFVFGLAFARSASAEVAMSMPVSVGSYNQWTVSSTLTKVSAVTTTDGDASYISESTNNDAQTYTMSGAGIPAGSTVNSVSLFVIARSSNNTPLIQLILENGATSSIGSSLSLTSDYSTYIRPLNVSPFTGSAWTVAEVNAWTVKFGVKKANGSGSTARVTQIFLLVDYTLDTTAPVVTQVTPVPTPTNDTTPTYTFHSTEAGTIFYGGNCANEIAPGGVGNHTITFGTLAPGIYSNCTIQIADASANTSTVLTIPSFTIDITAPVISPHDSVVAEATSSAGAFVNYTIPTATDNVDASVVVSCAPESGTLFAVGTTTVTCNATDTAGNTAASTSFDVGVHDTTAPVINSPVHGFAEATGPAGAVATYPDLYAVDAVEGTILTTCSPLSGSVFPVGESHVFCNVSDLAGNSAIPMQVNVTVRDTTPPAINLIGDPVINMNTGDIYVELGATAADLVDGDVTANIVVDSSSINNLVPAGYLVTYTVGDVHANTSTITRTVFVSDHSAPVITRIPDMTVEAASALDTIVDYGIIWASDDVLGDFPLSTASCLPLSGSTFPIGTTPVICTAVDSFSNIGVGLALNVIVQDTTAPVVVVTPDTQTVEATSAAGAEVSFTVTATDTVDTGVGFSLECTPESGAVFPLGATIITCTAQDEMGNSATGTAAAIVRDSIAPELTLPPNQTFEATGLFTTPVLIPATATDAVDPAPSVTSSASSFILGTTGISWQAMDASGNIAWGGVSNVTIVDTTAPVITLNGDATVTLTVGDTYTEQGGTLTDNFIIEFPVITIGGDVVNTAVAGTYHVTYDAHDISGNNAVQKIRTVVVNSIPSSGSGGTSGGGSSFVEPTPPSFGDQPITVGGGLGSTSTVTLTFNVQNASWMAISETPNFTNVSWLPYATNTTFTLSGTNTERKLYIKFRRVNGGETKAQEVTVLSNTPSTLIQAVLGVRITRLNELLAKLKLGSRGSEVVELQTLLKEAGFFPAGQAATGYYGPLTATAVKKALAASKAVLGVKIARVDELVAKLKVGDSSAEVTELQTLLKQAGYFPAAQAATGFYGSITNTAVKKYLAATK